MLKPAPASLVTLLWALQNDGKERGYYYGPDGTLVAFAHTIGYETYDGLGWYGVITQTPRS